MAGCFCMEQPVLTSPSPVQSALGPLGRQSCLDGIARAKCLKCQAGPGHRPRTLGTLCVSEAFRRGEVASPEFQVPNKVESIE